MQHKTAKKLGFWMAMTMLLGSVVGIGIFFKNGSVSQAVEGEGATWLAAWIVGGIIAATAAVSFSEMGFFKNTKLTGLGNWAHKVGGRGYGYFISFQWAFFYFGILSVILSFFGAEVLVFFISLAFNVDTSSIQTWHLVLISLAIAPLFVGTNFVSVKAGGWIQAVTTVLKFIPLVLAIVIGIALFNNHNAGGSNAFNKGGSTPNFKNMLIALPAVLFAYDSFLTVASLGKKVKNPTKSIPKIVIFGMLAVIVLYTLIAVSSILHSTGAIHDLFADSFQDPNVAKGFTIFTFLFLVFSTFGVINGFSAGFVAEMEQQQRLKLLVGSRSLSKKLSSRMATLVMIIGTMVFWAIVVFVPAIAMQTDKVIDGVSNFPTVYFFALHGVTIALYLWKRVKHPEWVAENRGANKKGLNSILIYSASVLAIVGLLGAVLINIVLLLQNVAQGVEKSSWGVFFKGETPEFLINKPGFGKDYGVYFTALYELAFWVPYLVLLILMPLLNWALALLVEKRNLVKDFDEIAGENELDLMPGTTE